MTLIETMRVDLFELPTKSLQASGRVIESGKYLFIVTASCMFAKVNYISVESKSG